MLRLAPAVLAVALAVAAHQPAAHAEARVASRVPAASPSDPHRTALLRVTFAEGTALETAGRWADALEKFEAVARVRRTPEVQFHIALCHEHLGRLRLAERWYRGARNGAAPGSAVQVETDERLIALTARIPRVTISLAGNGDGVVIELDGDRVQTGVALPVEPGPHLAVARRHGIPIAAVAFGAHERRAHSISLLAIDRPGAPQAAPGGTSPIARATPSR